MLKEKAAATHVPELDVSNRARGMTVSKSARSAGVAGTMSEMAAPIPSILDSLSRVDSLRKLDSLRKVQKQQWHEKQRRKPRSKQPAQ